MISRSAGRAGQSTSRAISCSNRTALRVCDSAASAARRSASRHSGFSGYDRASSSGANRLALARPSETSLLSPPVPVPVASVACCRSAPAPPVRQELAPATSSLLSLRGAAVAAPWQSRPWPAIAVPAAPDRHSRAHTSRTPASNPSRRGASRSRTTQPRSARLSVKLGRNRSRNCRSVRRSMSPTSSSPRCVTATNQHPSPDARCATYCKNDASAFSPRRSFPARNSPSSSSNISGPSIPFVSNARRSAPHASARDRRQSSGNSVSSMNASATSAALAASPSRSSRHAPVACRLWLGGTPPSRSASGGLRDCRSFPSGPSLVPVRQELAPATSSPMSLRGAAPSAACGLARLWRESRRWRFAVAVIPSDPSCEALAEQEARAPAVPFSEALAKENAAASNCSPTCGTTYRSTRSSRCDSSVSATRTPCPRANSSSRRDNTMCSSEWVAECSSSAIATTNRGRPCAAAMRS